MNQVHIGNRRKTDIGRRRAGRDFEPHRGRRVRRFFLEQCQRFRRSVLVIPDHALLAWNLEGGSQLEIGRRRRLEKVIAPLGFESPTGTGDDVGRWVSVAGAAKLVYLLRTGLW